MPCAQPSTDMQPIANWPHLAVLRIKNGLEAVGGLRECAHAHNSSSSIGRPLRA